MAHEDLARMIRFIGKQDGRVKIVRSKRRAKGRYR
jgi:hypothetical protein